jgi:integrase
MREGKDFPSKAELRAMLDAAPEKSRAFIVTLIFTGMRISELRGLPWRDVDLGAGVIHVRQRADAWAHIGRPKSKAGSRDIPLAPIVINALQSWCAACPKGELDLVFPNRHGRVQTLQNLRGRVFTPLQQTCGITVDGQITSKAKYGFHALRHAAASLFIAHLGWTPKRVQTVMGHAKISMTYDLYGHLFEDPEADREAMKKIETAILAA